MKTRRCRSSSRAGLRWIGRGLSRLFGCPSVLHGLGQCLMGRCTEMWFRRGRLGRLPSGATAGPSAFSFRPGSPGTPSAACRKLARYLDQLAGARARISGLPIPASLAECAESGAGVWLRLKTIYDESLYSALPCATRLHTCFGVQNGILRLSLPDWWAWSCCGV